MAEKTKRPVARRTLYRAIEEALEKYEIGIADLIGNLLDAIKDDWFRETK